NPPGPGALPPSKNGAWLGDGGGLVYSSPCCLGGFQIGLTRVPFDEANPVKIPPDPGNLRTPAGRPFLLSPTTSAAFYPLGHQVSLGGDVLPAGYGTTAILGSIDHAVAGHLLANHAGGYTASSSSLDGMAGHMLDSGPMSEGAKYKPG